ncbi:SWI/SNF complex subunit SMARCC1 [Histomonas meleagridis]|uniref:SWI/SNF complex subunit SMARCC1 n=1 Tax=Histomonas meleagridis TaxID=135588 RepID=UPI00355A4855|nr:SWI/SNF complex subunit SMARCC1 [Histomonas meleagridis]KAH0804838.1 SWI/SNF complex subunit SMARCC1 [Histomonas meleagridis]
MQCLSRDPFASPTIPKFIEFDIAIVRESVSSVDATPDFVSTLKAIRSVHQPPPVVIPKRAQFFDFSNISDFELQFSFAKDPLYKEIRNFMVAIYRIFSDHYLPYTLCRRNIKAPAHLTLQIWKFLKKYGLINYKINDRTKPNSLIPHFDRWPQLVFGVNEKLYTLNQYEKLLHPITKVSPQLSIPAYTMMTTPFVPHNRIKQSAEVPGLMTFANWTQKEISALIEAIKPHPELGSINWDFVSSKVRTKTSDECAEMAASLPLPYLSNVEHPSYNVHNAEHNLSANVNMINNISFSNLPEMRLVYRAVTAIGNEQSRAVLNGHVPDMPNDSLEAAGIMALGKISKNVQKMKQMHKERILKCLEKATEILKQSVEMKKALIEEAQLRVNEMKPSESEITSSDEKMWPSGNEEI